MLEGRLQEGRLQEGRLQEGRLQEGRLQEGRLQEGRLQEGRLQEGRLQEGRLRKGDSRRVRSVAVGIPIAHELRDHATRDFREIPSPVERLLRGVPLSYARTEIVPHFVQRTA